MVNLHRTCLLSGHRWICWIPKVHLATCLIEFIHTPSEPWFQTGSQMNWGLHPDNVVAQSYLDLDSVMTSFVPTVN